MPGVRIDNFNPKNTKVIPENRRKFQIVEILKRRTADRPFFDDLEALVYRDASLRRF